MILKDAHHHTILQLNQQDGGGWQGKQRGTYPLWNQVQQTYERFVLEHQPAQDRYEVDLTSQQALLTLRGKTKHDPHVLCDLYGS